MTVMVHCDRETFQARCGDCGWHTWPTAHEEWAQRMADLHGKVCPSPSPPRSGGLFECGCWNLALPGRRAGYSRDRCPRHGDVLMVQANVDEPTGKKLSPVWTAGALSDTPAAEK